MDILISTSKEDDVNAPEIRRFLYQLENKGISRQSYRKLVEGKYGYWWELTHKGKEVLSKDKRWVKLWQQKRIKELYQKLDTKGLLN